MALRDAALVRVAGKSYRVGRLIGSGGMGTVYEAEHVEFGRTVAIKFLRADRTTSPRVLKRFEREARIAARLEHENIVRLLELGADSGEPFLVFEFVRGRTLRRELDELGVRPLGSVLDIAAQVCRALAVAHEAGVVHRDLKPENIMLASHADGRLLVKLLDFGVARDIDGETVQLTNSEAAPGTAAYMSPEQARGERGLDQRTDIYTLGVVIYEALAGVRPYTGNSYNEILFRILNRSHRPLSELRPDLPSSVLEAVERALAKNRDDRFSTIHEFAEALAVGGVRTAVSPATPENTTITSEVTGEVGVSLGVDARPRRNEFLLGGVVGASLGAAVLAGLLFLWRWPRPDARVDVPPATAPVAADPHSPPTDSADVPKIPRDTPEEPPPRVDVPVRARPAQKAKAPRATPAPKPPIESASHPSHGDLEASGYIVDSPYQSRAPEAPSQK